MSVEDRIYPSEDLESPMSGGGLYNVVFGVNPLTDVLMDMLLAIAPFNPGRFRDIWVEHDGDLIIIRVFTRNGGGNREAYQREIDSMRAHPWYRNDADDSFDSTYADFYFTYDPKAVDPGVTSALSQLAVDHVDMSERWQAAIDAIKNS